MNKRNSKLIRKFAARKDDNPGIRKNVIKKLKRVWNSTPRHERHSLRQEME